MRSLRPRLLLALGLAVAALTGAGYGYHAASVTTTVSAKIASNQSSTLDLGTASYQPTLSYAPAQWTNGTGTNQFQIVYADSGTIAASDSIVYDFAGSATDAFGTTITCATLKAVMVTTKTTNTNNVLVGGAETAQIQFLNDTTDIVPVKPGGAFLWVAPGTGATVTGGTRDKMRLKNSAGTSGVGYSLQVLCR